MPWLETAPMIERLQFVQDAQSDRFTMAALCARHGVSRKTGYKWIARYAEEGRRGLGDRSRAPHTCPHRLAEATAALLVTARGWHLPSPRARRRRRVGPGGPTRGARRGRAIRARDRRPCRPALPLSHAQKAIAADGEEPAAAFRSLLVQVPIPVGLQEGVLHQVVRLGLVAGERQGDAGDVGKEAERLPLEAVVTWGRGHGAGTRHGASRELQSRRAAAVTRPSG